MSSTAFPQKHSGWTIHDLAELPDDGHRYEIVDGQPVMMAPVSVLHQIVAGHLRTRHLGQPEKQQISLNPSPFRS